jgi:HlyD family secretion protein
VAAESIHALSTGRPWVMKVDGRHARRQNIGVGLVSGGKAEILNGLQQGDLIIPATVSIKEGGRIRARTASVGAR